MYAGTSACVAIWLGQNALAPGSCNQKKAVVTSDYGSGFGTGDNMELLSRR
jgi:hypothetical protein